MLKIIIVCYRQFSTSATIDVVVMSLQKRDAQTSYILLIHGEWRHKYSFQISLILLMQLKIILSIAYKRQTTISRAILLSRNQLIRARDYRDSF